VRVDDEERGIDEERGGREGKDVPSLEANTLAQLSVLPAIMYSPEGLHARS
jgi:hypothetical protein